MTSFPHDGSRLRALRRRLAGRRVLVAGRSSFHLVLLTDLLQEAGCCISGPFRNVADVVTAVQAEPPDAGIVDVGGPATRLLDILDWLQRQHVPCLLVGSSVPGTPPAARVVAWPIDEEMLLRALLDCIDGAASSSSPVVSMEAVPGPGLHHHRM